MSIFWNREDSDKIICPYCGAIYEPSEEDTYINGEYVDCYTTIGRCYRCEECGKMFFMQGYRKHWAYITKTIVGEATAEEAEAKGWM